jgi:hypothetical protein
MCLHVLMLLHGVAVPLVCCFCFLRGDRGKGKSNSSPNEADLDLHGDSELQSKGVVVIRYLLLLLFENPEMKGSFLWRRSEVTRRKMDFEHTSS